MDTNEDINGLLSEINKNLSLSNEALKDFGNELFCIARITNSTFSEVAKATRELVQQGLDAEAVQARLRDALILSHWAGISSADAVDKLTKAVEEYNRPNETESRYKKVFVSGCTPITNGYNNISIYSDGGRHLWDTTVKLPDNSNLGMVQSIEWKYAVGDVGATCIIKTLMAPADLKALSENTEIRYRLIEDSSV